jgi:hypothetical protein
MKGWPFERAGTVHESKVFIVQGVLPFPIDMLRYDACYPASEADSSIINRSLTHDTRGKITVEVRTRSPLTVGRWKSFGWQVVGVKSL